MCLSIKIYKCFVSNDTNVSNFHPVEVVGRGSETQLQVGKNWDSKQYWIMLGLNLFRDHNYIRILALKELTISMKYHWINARPTSVTPAQSLANACPTNVLQYTGY